jgi:hypothetical protein
MIEGSIISAVGCREIKKSSNALVVIAVIVMA